MQTLTNFTAIPPARRNGNILLELALVLPVFLVIGLGTVEFGRAMWVGRELTDGARLGAERAMIRGATKASIEHDVKYRLQQSLAVEPADVNVAIALEGAPGHEQAITDLAAAQTQDLVEVTIRVPYEQVAFAFPGLLSGANLQGRCAMRLQ